jgi:hypothetical protein
MKEEYDFTNAEQGKFYRPGQRVEAPVYVDGEVLAFFQQKSQQKNIGVDSLVNSILKKEMEIIQALE